MGKSIKYQPINHRVIVKLLKMPERTAGGLYLTEEYKDGGPGQVREGEVIAASIDSEYEYNDQSGVYERFIPGQIVLVWPLEGQSINLDGEEYKLFKDEQILAIVK